MERLNLPWASAAAIAASLLPLLSACGGDGSEETRAPTRPELASGADRIGCAVGKAPTYFVPGEPATIIGCAKLGASGKQVELSTSPEVIEGRSYTCINPAYAGRGQRGIYIPTVCDGERRVQGVSVLDASRPEQSVEGFGFVVWGVAQDSATSVTLQWSGGRTRAARFRACARGMRSRPAGPFQVWVAELPRGARCDIVGVLASMPARPPARARALVPPSCRRGS